MPGVISGNGTDSRGSEKIVDWEYSSVETGAERTVGEGFTNGEVD